nr:GNAT family N-acetyltransferase [Cytobacillus oceanisediminis]
MAVSSKGEGKGIGKSIMEKAVVGLSKKDIINSSYVFVKNDRAVNFYRHLNYETEVLKW